MQIELLSTAGRCVASLGKISLLSVLAVATLAGGCSDDDDDSDGGGASAGVAGRAGSSSAGQSSSGSPNGGSTAGRGGSGVAGQSTPAGGNGSAGDDGEGGAAGAPAGAAGAAGAGGSDDRAEFRPEELPFDQAAFDALTLPENFTINVYRSGLGQARMLGVHGPHVYVTQPEQGNVVLLRDENEDGVAEAQAVVASSIPMVHGIAFHDDDVFLANVKSVYRGSVAQDGSFGTLTEIISDLPDGGQHPRRTLGVGPDELLYISIGSSCDACAETNPEHATLLRSTLTGQDAATRTIFAEGLRNTIGFAWHPTTDELWGMDQGSDWRGNDLPPEELNAIVQGRNYGWPYCYGNRSIDTVIQDPPSGTKQALCAQSAPPALLNQAHQSPIGMAFYTGDTFPARYQDGAFVAFRGSWNRKPATGYRVAFIPFDAGEPTAIEDFVSGFLNDEGTATFGRPAGVAVAPDGALLFTDDTNGIVYRVQYEDP
jgi:glucose/arabinose dehydrogenase